LDRQIGDEKPIDAAGLSICSQRLEPVGEKWVVITEKDERKIALFPHPADQFQALAQRESVLQSSFSSLLNHGTIGKRIRERDTQFNDVSARLFQFKDQPIRNLEVGISQCNVRNERFLAVVPEPLKSLLDASHRSSVVSGPLSRRQSVDFEYFNA